MALPVDIYTRSGRASEGSSSHEQQEREARDFARAHGLTIGRVLTDRTKSSSGTLDRPVLQEALRRVESGESSGVMVAYLSRASRDTRQGLSCWTGSRGRAAPCTRRTCPTTRPQTAAC